MQLSSTIFAVICSQKFFNQVENPLNSMTQTDMTAFPLYAINFYDLKCIQI